MLKWLVTSEFVFQTTSLIHVVPSSFVFAFALGLHLTSITFLIYLSSLIGPRRIGFFRLSYFMVTFLCLILANNSIYVMGAHIHLTNLFTNLLWGDLTCFLFLQNPVWPWFPLFWISVRSWRLVDLLSSNPRKSGTLKETLCLWLWL